MIKKSPSLKLGPARDIMVNVVVFFFFFFFLIRNEEDYINKRTNTGEKKETKEREKN